MKGHLFNIDNGYLEGLCRGFKNGILRQADYLNLVQCETLEDLKKLSTGAPVSATAVPTTPGNALFPASSDSLSLSDCTPRHGSSQAQSTPPLQDVESASDT